MASSHARFVLLVTSTLVAFAAAAPQVDARPLSLTELDEFNRYVTCASACVREGDTYAAYVAYETCLIEGDPAVDGDDAECGLAPRLWEKNGIPPIDEDDYQLALLELFHTVETPESAPDPANLICYADADEEIVVPGPMCVGPVCASQELCTEEQCADDDDSLGDVTYECVGTEESGVVCWYPIDIRPAYCTVAFCEGFDADSCDDDLPVASVDDGGEELTPAGNQLPDWLDNYFADADGDGAPDSNVPLSVCGGVAACDLDHACQYDPELGRGTCEARACLCAPADADCTTTCTAFHLEQVAHDDQEVIFHVWYDHTPTPARTLDLYLEYDQAAMTLHDARRLPSLVLNGKKLATTHLSDGTLRLSVLDDDGTHAIPTGPIVELVFALHSQASTTLGFAKTDALQYKAVAPFQGDAAHDELTNDGRWGPTLHVAGKANARTRLRLHYGFESIAEPLTYANVPTADELCSRIADCANEPDEVVQARFIAKLEALQAGRLAGGDTTVGVSNTAGYFDGSNDHLRLPVHHEDQLDATQQHLSWSTWFYTDGKSANELAETPQLLFTHNALNERTSFGVKLVKNGNLTWDLVFFAGDLLSTAPAPTELVVAPVRERSWHHAGLSLNALNGSVSLYLDGALVNGLELEQPPTAIQCPQFHAGTDVVLHTEGDVLGGTAPELVYFAARVNNLWRIERMEATGLDREVVIGGGQLSARDPDYSAILDRVVFSSNASGDFEIWIADGDGNDARQVTFGFGDAFRGFAARHPRWAPDGTGIVFQSDAYDVLLDDNSAERVNHLYYVGYDPVADSVDIQLTGGGVATELDYEALLAAQTVSDHRLTSSMLVHHTNPRWLVGKDAADGTRGELLIDTAGPQYGGRTVQRLVIDDITQSSSVDPIEPALGTAEHEVRLLAAHRSVKAAFPEDIETRRVFFERSFEVYDAHDQFTVAASVQDDAEDDVLLHRQHVTVVHAPDCSDTGQDCDPADVRDLYVLYDEALWAPVLEDDDGNPLSPGAVLTVHKELTLGVEYPAGQSYVKVQILSPLDATPIPSGELAVLQFRPVSGAVADGETPEWPDTSGFAAHRRDAVDEWLVRDLVSGDTTAFTADGLFEHIQDATFSPDGDSLLLSAISLARPVLLKSTGLFAAVGSASLLVQSTSVGSLSWRTVDRFYPCNWVGTYTHPQSRALTRGFRGGLDDLKVYSGLRDEDAFRSEAERGFEFLEREGLAGDGAVAPKLPSCGSSHQECPAYHLCVDSECLMIPCDPTNPSSCSGHGGRCTLRPAPVEQEYTGPGGAPLYDWVCAADCTVDADCFSQPCLNGPCRFCEPDTLTCVECRHTVKTLGAATIAQIEGCPDQRAFTCEAGACLTECYAFENDQSIYMCDATLEYCEQGHCVLHDWEWYDFAPMSMSGGAATRFANPGEPYVYTQAVDRSVPISITTYGVADHLQSPEIVVEVNGGPFYTDWHRVGSINVRARTVAEAQARPLTLLSDYPFADMRLRLVTPPYENLSGGAHGLVGDGDDPFCVADLEAHLAAHDYTGVDPADIPDVSLCQRRGQGSRYTLGYRLGIPEHEAIAACKAHGHVGCPVASDAEYDYLHGGQPAAVVLDIQVEGASAMNSIVTNPVCAYGTADGVGLIPDDGGAPAKVLYGANEASNLRDALCAEASVGDDDAPELPAFCAGSAGLVEFNDAGQGFALLNCNVVDGTDLARIEIQNLVMSGAGPAASGAIIHDDGDTCTVEVSGLGVTPCHSWMSDATVDPGSGLSTFGASEVIGGLEIGLFRSFGHDDGFTSVPQPPEDLQLVPDVPAGVDISGLLVVVDAAPVAPATVLSGGVVATKPPGKMVDLLIPEQPTAVTTRCSFCGPVSTAACDVDNCEFPCSEGTAQVDGDDVVTCDAPGVTLDCDKHATKCDTAIQIGGLTVGLVCRESAPVEGTISGHDGPVQLRLTYESVNACGAVTSSSPKVHKLTVLPGASEFSAQLGLLDDATVVLTVENAPPGHSCTVSGLAVTCEVLPPGTLQVDVVGLEGSGLTLLEVESEPDQVLGVDASISSDGDAEVVTASFGETFSSSSPFEILIATQPTSPVQVCAIATGGTGLMPDTSAHVGATVTCTTIPTYPVGGTVYGLTGEGLKLVMGDEEIEIEPDETPGTSVLFEFATPLFSGETYDVQVSAVPDGELGPQTCEVVNGTGTIDGAAPDVSVVCYPDLDTTSYALSGTVTGLKGEQLKLVVNNGPFVSLDGVTDSVTGEGEVQAFEFDFPFGDDVDYEVVVGKQPTDPPQQCTVVNNVGTFNGADVTDVEVTCVDAIEVSVSLTASNYLGRLLKVRVFSAGQGGKLVAREAEGAYINGLAVDGAVGKAFDPAEEDDDPDDGVTPTPTENLHLTTDGSIGNTATLLEGDYWLMVWIHDGVTFTTEGDPIYLPGGPALVQYVTLESDDVIELAEQQLTIAASKGIQALLPEDTPEDSSLECFWSTSGTAPLVLPPADDAPVVGRSVIECQLGDDCVDDDKLTTIDNDGLPIALGVAYDVTCALDTGDGTTTVAYDTDIPPQAGAWPISFE